MQYKIISGQYEHGTREQQQEYQMLLGKDNTQYKFDLYFHWYNIIHELGHCIIDVQNINLSNVQEEMFANEFAVAYWKYIGCDAQISELENMLKEILTGMPSPVPDDIHFLEYYQSIWGTEVLNSVMLYGYFQLKSVLTAIEHNKSLETVLASINIKMGSVHMAPYSGVICAQKSRQVLNAALTNISKLNIASLEVSIELVDDPMVQCAREVV